MQVNAHADRLQRVGDGHQPNRAKYSSTSFRGQFARIGTLAPEDPYAGVTVAGGTVRLIERDDETFPAWAHQRYACVIFNLHTEHTAAAIERTAENFRHLIDLGIERDGSFFLTYHRWARREQVEACYPQMREFLAHKLAYDPHERFQSDWYRHLLRMFA